MIVILCLVGVGLAACSNGGNNNARTTSGTIGGGDVFTEARGADACGAQASAFTDYPLVWAGPSVLGYPLTVCNHMMTKTRYAPDGSVSHPGGDSWAFGYGTCTTPKGSENCALPITIIIDPCALTVDGRIIPKGSQPARSMTVRGAQAAVGDHGISFEQSPQIISISASGSSPDAEKQVANAVLIAEALVPANAPAATAAAASAADTLITATFSATKVACP